MSMRVTEMMKFNTMTANLSTLQSEYTSLMEKMATQKAINKPSDDPLGMSLIMNYRSSQAAVEKYQSNIESANAWITVTESTLNSVNDLIVHAREIALSQATGTATAETRSYNAETVNQLIEELQSLANTKYGGSYIFSGTKTKTLPFVTEGSSLSRLSEPYQAKGNSFNGVLEVSGNYSGDANKTYVVKVVGEASTPGYYEYEVSEDGGHTWFSDSLDNLTVGTAVNIGNEGVQLTMTAITDPPEAGDIMYVDAFAPGYYEGNGEKLALAIGKGVSFEYSISGEEVFTAAGGGTVDLFDSLTSLKEALQSNDPDAISAELDRLEASTIQINKNVARCGTQMNRLEIATDNLSNLKLKITELLSSKEDVDITELVTELSMKEITLQASYQMASTIGNISLLEFLK